MGHYAKIENGIVTEVVVSKYNHINKQAGEWVKTSYNMHGGIHKRGKKPLRKNYAGIGYTYDSVKDVFIPPQPYDSWTLNEDTCLWDAPVSKPQDGAYLWNENNQEWEAV